jgi:hypothetical protein
MDWEDRDRGAYCEHCDGSFSEGDLVVERVNEWSERYGCPLCGHIEPRTYPTDHYVEVGLYLLQAADEDTYPWQIYLPAYIA